MLITLVGKQRLDFTTDDGTKMTGWKMYAIDKETKRSDLEGYQIFDKFLGPYFIVCDNKPDSLIAPCPIDHMALLGIHTSDQLNRKFTLFYPAYELVIFFQFPKRGK